MACRLLTSAGGALLTAVAILLPTTVPVRAAPILKHTGQLSLSDPQHIDGARYDAHSFKAKAGAVTITLIGAAKPYLLLFDDQQQLILTQTQQQDSHIRVVTAQIPEEGTYWVQASTRPEETGPYRLLINQGSQPDQAWFLSESFDQSRLKAKLQADQESYLNVLQTLDQSPYEDSVTQDECFRESYTVRLDSCLSFVKDLDRFLNLELSRQFEDQSLETSQIFVAIETHHEHYATLRKAYLEAIDAPSIAAARNRLRKILDSEWKPSTDAPYLRLIVRLWLLFDPEQGIEILQQAAQQSLSEQNPAQAAEYFGWISDIYAAHNRPQLAQQAAEEGLALWKQQGNHLRAAQFLDFKVALPLDRLGKTQAALSKFRQAASFYQKWILETREGEGVSKWTRLYTLKSFAKEVDRLAQTETAEAQTEAIKLGQAIDIFLAQEAVPQVTPSNFSDEDPGALSVMNRLSYLSGQGRQARLEGRYAGALQAFQAALSLHRQTLDVADPFNTRGELLDEAGKLFIDIGQHEQAVDVLQQALAIAEGGSETIADKNSTTDQNFLFNNIGLAYRGLGELEKGLEYLLLTFKYYNVSGLGLANIGSAYLSLGQADHALKICQKAISQETKGWPAGVTLHCVGEAHLMLGQYREAADYYAKALPFFRGAQGLKDGEGKTLLSLSIALAMSGQLEAAESRLNETIQVLESTRSGDLGDLYKVALNDTQTTAYEYLQQVLVAQGRTDEALEVAEKARSRAFAESIIRTQAAGNVDRPPSLAEIKTLAQQSNATLVEYSVIESTISDPFYGPKRRLKGWSKDSTIGQQFLYIWVIQPTGKITFRSVPLEDDVNQQRPETQIAQLATAAYGNVRGRQRAGISVVRAQKKDQSSRYRQLHQLLIEPIVDLLPDDPEASVVFSPQGSLYMVPFAALQDAQGRYLIEEHTLQTTPSLQVFDLARQTQAKRQSHQAAPALVVGNPTMPPNLSPLPGAEREGDAIASLLKTTALKGDQATESTVKQQMTRASLIHFATHGLLEYDGRAGTHERDLPGAIALAADDQNDGLLTAAELLNLELNADLVVLSACDTGRGKITGDGVLGLSRSLMTAGVPSVVVSLWAVPDAPTAELMTIFYQQLQQGQNKAQALRQAMLATLKRHPDPEAWAAFYLMGTAQ